MESDEDTIQTYKSRKGRKKNDEQKVPHRRIERLAGNTGQESGIGFTSVQRPIGNELVGFSDSQRALKKLFGEDLGSIEKIEEALIIKNTIIFDSQFRDCFVWPTSMRFQLNWNPDVNDLGPITGLAPIKNVIRIRLLEARLPNWYNMPVDDIDVGFNAPYVFMHIETRTGVVYGSFEPFGSQGFYSLLTWETLPTPHSAVDIRVDKIIGGDITFDPPLLLLDRMQLITCNQNGVQIDTASYDGIPIISFDNTVVPNACQFVTSQNHNLINGDNVSLDMNTGEEIDEYTWQQVFDVTVVNATTFNIPLEDLVDIPIIGVDTIGYMKRYDFNVTYIFEITSLNKHVA